MKKILLLSTIFVLSLSLSVFSFGLPKLGGSSGGADFSKYDKAMEKIGYVVLIQELNESILKKGDVIEKLLQSEQEIEKLKQLSTLNETQKGDLERLEKEQKDKEKELKDLNKQLKKIDGKIKDDKIISKLNPEAEAKKLTDSIDSKKDEIEESEKTKESQLSQIAKSEKGLKKYKDDLDDLKLRTVVALGLNAGVFFLVKDAVQDVIELSKTIKDDAQKDAIKGAKYVSAFATGVVVVPKFVSQIGDTVKNMNRINRFAKAMKGEDVNKDKE
ncbi:MAG TPA: hypothetical protein PKY81_17220 [bacterium]|nr:hypothetical protein [bacterium]